jgi:hypothetical protein
VFGWCVSTAVDTFEPGKITNLIVAFTSGSSRALFHIIVTKGFLERHYTRAFDLAHDYIHCPSQTDHRDMKSFVFVDLDTRSLKDLTPAKVSASTLPILFVDVAAGSLGGDFLNVFH